MTALVTGGAGFIGSELVRRLEQAGVRVRVFDNFASGKRSNLAETEAEIIEGDVRDPVAVARSMQSVEQVFHLACVGVRRSIHLPREAHDVNSLGTLILLQAAFSQRVARFVHVSSSEVYGGTLHAPITEDHPCFPTTPYGASKLAGEACARAWHTTYGLPVVVVRPFNTFGPRCHHEGDSGEVIPKFMLRAWARRPAVIFGDGLQTRDFTYVADTAQGILAASQCADAIGHTFNLGSGREVSILELARIAGVGEITHEAARPGDVRRLVCNPSRARAAFGFRATVTLEAGLAQLREWYQRQGVAPETLLKEEVVYNWRPNAGPSEPLLAG